MIEGPLTDWAKTNKSKPNRSLCTREHARAYRWRLKRSCLEQRGSNNQLSLPDALLFSQHITNPRKAKGQQDLVVNNPLSQDEGVSEPLSAVSLPFIIWNRWHGPAVESLTDVWVPFVPVWVHSYWSSFPCSWVKLKLILLSKSSAVLLSKPWGMITLPSLIRK